MRAILTILLGAIAAVALAAHPAEDRGPGVAPTRDGDARVFAVGNFDSVVLGAGTQVEVRVGPSFSVRATGPDAAFAQLRVAGEKGALTIQRRHQNQERSNAQRDADTALERQVRFVVTLPRLTAVTLGGSGTINVDQVQARDFSATLGGSGRLTLGKLTAERTSVTIGGSGIVTAAGNAGSLSVMLGGSGRLEGPQLRATTASISSAGSGTVIARVEGKAHVSTVGSGRIDLGPAARCEISSQGRSAVRCGS